MPKFAANLTMMFNEVPFLDRFEAAAKAGFKYVEFLWPYDYPAQELKAILDKHGLKVVLFNTPAGDVNKGEWGGRQSLAEKLIAIEILIWLLNMHLH
ncbi:hypothetical protein CGSHi22421_08663 [Haemophilus influenzae R3021]|uniref:Xylose isomerase-like TIM barrel domain-containing protein n=1 Tax=Haemophilus influenzae R3021 TaxID=375432 RepID=A4N1V6_HAEIF|nr:hypothetical protein CGSHi22421_08663 [Haemophilus influenzae R3021]